MACALVTDTSDVLYSIFLGLDSHSAKDAKTKDVFNYSLERERGRERGGERGREGRRKRD